MSTPVTIDDIYKLFQASKEEYDRRAAEADRRMVKLEKTVDRTSKAVEALTTRWGRFQGKAPMTADVDLRLCRYFGLSDGYFLRLHYAYELMEAKRNLGDILRQIVPIALLN